MKGRYVEDKGWFGDDEFEEYFTGWKEQYEDNILKYIDCDYASWSEVADKWNELTEMFAELKKDSDSVNPDTTSAEDDDEEDAGLGVKDTAGSKVGNFFKKHLGFNASFVAEVPQNLSNLFNNDDSSEEDASSDEEEEAYDGTIVSLYDEYISAVDQYENEYLEAELMAKYATLYGEGGADIADSFVMKLQDLEVVLEGSYKTYIPDVTKMTKKISNKQCSD